MSETEGLPTEPMEPAAPEEAAPEEETETSPEPGDDDAETEADGQEAPESPGSGEEPAPPPLDEKEIERVYKHLGKLRETTANRVSAIMGDDAIALQPCPVCGEDIPGHVWQVPFEDTIEPIYHAVRAWLGLGIPMQLKRHESFQTCGDCDGMGAIDTGSKREGYESATCPRCVGKGYLSGLEVGQPAPPVMTGPTADLSLVQTGNGQELPAELQAYKDQGWMIGPPIDFSQVGKQG